MLLEVFEGVVNIERFGYIIFFIVEVTCLVLAPILLVSLGREDSSDNRLQFCVTYKGHTNVSSFSIACAYVF